MSKDLETLKDMVLGQSEVTEDMCLEYEKCGLNYVINDGEAFVWDLETDEEVEDYTSEVFEYIQYIMRDREEAYKSIDETENYLRQCR